MNNMEKKIAIRGHKTRGVEVIDILKQLGGRNFYSLVGSDVDNIYFIGNNNEIHYASDALIDTDKFQIYTLEEYLESLQQTVQIKSTNMEKTIAIRGHKNRSIEVIDILKQLGGKNNYALSGEYESNIYFIGNDNEIDYMPLTIKNIDKFYQIYTLEEYLETLNQTEQIKSTNMEKVIEQKNNNTQRQLSVDIETAKQWYKTNNETLKQLALSLFTEEELTKVEFPTTWEEFCNKYPNVNNEWYVNGLGHIDTFKKGNRNSDEDRNLLETQEDAEAILALIQLKRLRDDWWKVLNYQPNWTNEKEKYCIVIYENDITFDTRSFSNTLLAFPTQESRNQFFEYFKDLILKAKPFLS